MSVRHIVHYHCPPRCWYRNWLMFVGLTWLLKIIRLSVAGGLKSCSPYIKSLHSHTHKKNMEKRSIYFQPELSFWPPISPISLALKAQAIEAILIYPLWWHGIRGCEVGGIAKWRHRNTLRWVHLTAEPLEAKKWPRFIMLISQSQGGLAIGMAVKSYKERWDVFLNCVFCLFFFFLQALKPQCTTTVSHSLILSVAFILQFSPPFLVSECFSCKSVQTLDGPRL